MRPLVNVSTLSRPSTGPIHFLGLTQIISYGFLFYSFALLKEELSVFFNVSVTHIAGAITCALMMQAALSYVIGHWVDRFGGFSVLSVGLLIGGLGLGLLTVMPTTLWLWGCFALIGCGFAMSTYEVAFGTAVQFDEAKSRHYISVVSLYGGVASSFVWLLLAPLLHYFDLAGATLIASLLLCGASFGAFLIARYTPHHKTPQQAETPSFSLARLSYNQRRSLGLIASASAIQYLIFSGAALFWISWYGTLFNDMSLAVMLASLYGPFQVVGRFLDMRFGKAIDARLSAIIASLCFCVSLWLAQYASLPAAIIAMMLFGMGNGALTVAWGFLTNLYFQGAIYSRANGIVAAPKAIAMAAGPVLAALTYERFGGTYLILFLAVALIVAILLLALLRLAPENEVAARQSGRNHQ